jgi:two-component system, chemotaxis family, sensor kinase CheA
MSAFNWYTKSPQGVKNIYHISAAFVCIVVISMGYAINRAQKTNETVNFQMNSLHKMESLGEVNKAFGVFRSWSLDLMISTQRDSLIESKKAAAELQSKIEAFETMDGDAGTKLHREFESLSAASFAASDAYISNNKVLGNSLMGNARTMADNFSLDLSTELGKASEQLNNSGDALVSTSTDMKTNLSWLGLIAIVAAIVISSKNISSFFALEKAKSELASMNQNLEKIVEERTRQIRTIIDNVQSGFFIVGPSLTVEGGATKSCQDLFKSQVENRSLLRVLGMNELDQENYKGLVEQVFESPMFEEMSIEQLPKRFGTMDGRLLHASPTPVKNEQGDTTSLLYNINDITLLQQTEKKAALQASLITILKRRDGFLRFIGNFKENIAVSHKIVVTKTQDGLRAILHTLKGNSSSFGLHELAALIHHIEGQEDISAHELHTISGDFESFLKEHFAILGIEYNAVSRSVYEVSKEELQQLEKSTLECKNFESLKNAVKSWAYETQKLPAGALIADMEPYVNDLAKRLEKTTEFRIVGGNLKVDHAALSSVCENLVHAFRNSIDHGIEKSRERLAFAKPAAGKIVVEFSENSENWNVSVWDDGRGIDIEKVKEQAIRKNLVTSQQVAKLSNAQIMEFIFKEDFSTATEVSEISGRGVGLSALKSAATQAGGNIVVSSETNRGTRFMINIPKSDQVQSSHKSA